MNVRMENILKKDALSELLKAAPHLLKFPVTKMWINYDKEADVLYIGFNRPQKATDSEMSQDGILHRYRGEKLVGINRLIWRILLSEVWNRFGTKILPKLHGGTDLKIGINFSVSMEAGITKSFEAELKQILEDLNLTERVKVE